MSMHIDQHPEALLERNAPVSQEKYKAHYVHLREANVVNVRRCVRDTHAAVNLCNVNVKRPYYYSFFSRWR